MDGSVSWRTRWRDRFHAAPGLTSSMRRADPARKLGSNSCEPIKIKQLFPLKINEFAVHDGEVHYCDFNKEPKAVRLHRRVLPALSFLRCVQMFTLRRPPHRASGPPRRRSVPWFQLPRFVRSSVKSIMSLSDCYSMFTQLCNIKRSCLCSVALISIAL